MHGSLISYASEPRRDWQSTCSSHTSELDIFLCEIFLLMHLSTANNTWCSLLFGVPGCCLYSSLWGGPERAEMDRETLVYYFGLSLKQRKCRIFQYHYPFLDEYWPHRLPMEAATPLHPFPNKARGPSSPWAAAHEVPVRQRRPLHTSDLDGAELLHAAGAAAADGRVGDAERLFVPPRAARAGHTLLGRQGRAVARGSVHCRNLHAALFVDLLIHKLVVLAQRNPTKGQSTHGKIIEANMLITIV